MRKAVVFAVIALFLFSGVAIADWEKTSRGTYTVPSSIAVQDWLNSTDCVSHKHDYKQYERRMQLGAYLDVELYKLNEAASVGTEYKFDFMNKEHQVYVGMSISLPEMFGY